MDMSVLAGSSVTQTGIRNPQARTSTDFAAALAAARSSAAAPSRIQSPLRAALILPTRQNVQQLASMLAQKLAARFAAAGLPQVPAVGFSVDGAGDIQVSGKRSDLAAIDTLVSSDADLQRAIRATNAVASHAYGIENGGPLQVQRAYRMSSDPQEIVAQYASLFGGERSAATTSVTFSAGTVAVTAAGQTWVTG